MRVWRMAFRVGSNGPEMWPKCLHFGVAAITYDLVSEIDFSKRSEEEFKKICAKLAPAQKYSLRQVRYEMKKGDVIYVKEGPKIVGKGIIKGPYHFDGKSRIIDDYGVPWTHQVPVKWVSDFTVMRMSIGDQQHYTVRELTHDDLLKLDTGLQAAIQKEALEGQEYTREVTFRRKNGALIQAKKSNSDYRCEVCGFSFEKTYGMIGREYIVAHHIDQLSSRAGASNTKIEDIALLCANCHAMVHTKNPSISPEHLKRLLRRQE